MVAETRSLGIVLISGDQERAHYAFMLAVGAAAIGRSVVLFATNAGCHALLADPSGLRGWEREAQVAESGVASLAELRAAAGELGVRLLLCQSGLRISGLESAALMPGAEIAGIATFLSATGNGQLISL